MLLQPLSWFLLFHTARVFSLPGEDDFDRLMEEPDGRENWVDPMDMGLDSEDIDRSDKDDLLENCRVRLQQCSDKLEARKNISDFGERGDKVETNGDNVKKKEECKVKVVDTFLKRHVSSLLHQMKLSVGDSGDAHLQVEVKLTSQDLSQLREYVNGRDGGSVNVQDVDQVLSSFILATSSYQPTPASWLPILPDMTNLLLGQELREPLLLLVATSLLVYTVLLLMKVFPPWKLALVLLLFSVSWHWLRLYKKAWAAKHATLVKDTSIPHECRPQDMTWLQSLQFTARSAFTSEDRCGKYHEAIMVDPLYEVNPLTALVDLTSNLLLVPLSKLGAETGAMFSSLLSNVPLFWQVPVLVVFVLILMFLMVLVAGYRVRLPMFLGTIEPASGGNMGAVAAEELAQIRAALENIQAGQKVSAVTVAARDAVEDKTDDRGEKSEVGEEVLPLEMEHHRPAIQKIEKLALTPVKKRTYDAPATGSETPVNFAKLKITGRGSGDDVLDLSKKQVEKENNALILTPTKKLVVRGPNDSPSRTEFTWINDDALDTDEDEVEIHMEVNNSPENIGCNKKQFISAVEEIFDETEDL